MVHLYDCRLDLYKEINYELCIYKLPINKFIGETLEINGYGIRYLDKMNDYKINITEILRN